MAEEKMENKIEEKKNEKAEVKEVVKEVKAEVKKEEKKPEKKKIVKKDEAVMKGNDLPISKKHSMAICDFIRGRNPEKAAIELEKVVKLKKAIKMKGEIPHRHGNMMSGRYPVNASKVFIKLLRTLNANASVNGLENPVVKVAIANDAARAFKRGGRERFKRINIMLVAREKEEKMENKGKENKQEKK